jgi:hypothetical protein
MTAIHQVAATDRFKANKAGYNGGRSPTEPLFYQLCYSHSNTHTGSYRYKNQIPARAQNYRYL